MNNQIILNYRTEHDRWVIDFNHEQENFGVFKAFLEQLEFDIQQDNIKRLVLCMRKDNKSVLAQAVLDYMKEINAPIDTEKRDE
ncbi:hypothetical protein UFOVP1043_49 [uncultured Caudovirales phage]|jgi:hypothetical protein|uniref:Uncharacterized protein n=1 Tax=uncultured Caudovirales phage TaxID=2100421 RepID=A0A6J5QLS8_9CAUD|nr:hypothetical protein UFOVP1043_49 [uncultured Caudovirales phage]